MNDTSQTPSSGEPATEPAASGSLTYEPFYGLREKPFSLSADPKFLFRSPAHAPAFDSLLAGIRRREGLIVLTGEIGAGKTTVCRSVLQNLDRRTFAAFVPDPFVSREDLLKTLLVDFGVISIGDLAGGRFNGASRSDLSYPLYEFLDSLVPLQAFAVLIIDEAQNLSLPLLEEIRILSELERREKLLQVVLVGQPELRASLKLPQMRQVDQRVSVRCELNTLDADAVVGYVNHRLGVAGFGKNRVEFTGPAFDALYQGSAGVPRLINRICDRALQRAYAVRSMRVDAPFVWDAINDLGLTAIAAAPARSIVQQPAAPPAIVEAPVAPQPRPALEVVINAEPEADLSEFADESAITSHVDSGWHAWVPAAVAGLLVVATLVGGAAWYARATLVEDVAVAGLLPPRPARSAQPAVELPQGEHAIAEPIQQQSATPSTPAQSAADIGYSIVVASFESRARADRLVEELTTAGFRARAIERDGGPTHGRLHQVTVGAYASAIDVQRDLQHIRELPGRYSDARIVERQ